MKNILFSILMLVSVYLCARPTTILIEAEGFDKKGGWVIDQQFMEQMGSAYLLAHGLGEPVANASTTVKFPEKATYHFWVRTKNWRTGNWSAPGQFKILVDGKESEIIFGTQPGWDWQYGGIVKIETLTTTITLRDLTGFDGRCDAICFSTGSEAPPSDGLALMKWRQEISGKQGKLKSAGKFDLVVTGGGVAGCAAAIAAAQQGLTVALIHDRSVFGGNASSEIRVHTEGITSKADKIVSLLNTKNWPNGSPEAEKDDRKRHENVDRYPNIIQFLEWRVYGVKKNGKLITSVKAKQISTGDCLLFEAPLFADCTGDGWIGYWAGASYMYGREEYTRYNEDWTEHGDLWSPGEADNRVMGSSLLWRSFDSGSPVSFPKVPWALNISKDHLAIKGEWQWEYSNNELNQIDDAEEIRDHLLCAIYGSFFNVKQQKKNANLKLEWVGYLAGKRESRRLVGDYIYTFNDVRELRSFPDAVVWEKRAVDIHYQQNLVDSLKPDFLSEALFYRTEQYAIPFRCLYSKDIGNLMMAGRCFSCSHVGLGGPRVMNTTGQMGVAVGFAASLCRKFRTTPRDVGKKHLDELLKLINE